MQIKVNELTALSHRDLEMKMNMSQIRDWICGPEILGLF